MKTVRINIVRLLATTILNFVIGMPAVAQAPATADGPPKELDDYLKATVKDWEFPGLAVAVVKGGKVIVVRGYGVRELGNPELVNGETVFDVASLTKSFTAAGIASLVDEKKMSWDDPVRRHIPALDFPDPYLTAHVTIRDLLSHRTGVRSTNTAWYLSGVDRSKLLDLVKNMEMGAAFRTRMVYSNVGYTIAGEAAARAARTTWDQLITDRLIVPLGMKRTTAVFTSPPAENFASGHALINGVQRVTPREGKQRDVTAPAGAIQSSAADLAIWMLFHLGDGTYQGKRILNAPTLKEMHSPQTLIPTNEAFRKSRQMKYDFAAYCLGWQVIDYRGNRMLWHTGSGDGQTAFMGLLPDSNIGVVVLINSWKAGGAAINGAIASRIMDYYLDLPTRDYSAEFRQSWTKSIQQQTDAIRTFEASRIKETRPTLPISQYAGVYRDKLGLEVKVWLEGDALRLQYGGGEVAVMTHWHHDTFRARWENPLLAEQRSTLVQFSLSPQATVVELSLNPGDQITARR
ncbi:MAG TPA: serine hydrolase [Pyrinomonadaceae bacterium]|nr:serine hydrolase [Pyrinomonadaceae bacterium]